MNALSFSESLPEKGSGSLSFPASDLDLSVTLLSAVIKSLDDMEGDFCRTGSEGVEGSEGSEGMGWDGIRTRVLRLKYC